MLQSDGNMNWAVVNAEKNAAEKSYPLHINDRLEISVYTDKGERLIDPNKELSKDIRNQSSTETLSYLIRTDSLISLPMVGEQNLVGMSLGDAEKKLQQAYSAFYKTPYVQLRVKNRRVTVLGATGGQVIPLENEDMNVLEVLALAGGLPKDSKAQNIRLIRGPLNAPQVQVIDLSTIDGMQKAQLEVEPGDIIYVEPVRRVLSESVRDIAPLIGIVSNVVTLIVVILKL